MYWRQAVTGNQNDAISQKSTTHKKLSITELQPTTLFSLNSLLFFYAFSTGDNHSYMNF